MTVSDTPGTMQSRNWGCYQGTGGDIERLSKLMDRRTNDYYRGRQQTRILSAYGVNCQAVMNKSEKYLSYKVRSDANRN
jgi:hypothetical protein